MKKSLIMILAAFVVILTGCVKDLEKKGIHSITQYKGRVIEKSENAPMEGVTVSVSDGTHVHASSTTDAQGQFEMEVNFDDLNDKYALHLDCQNYPSMTEALKGMGSEVFDYRDIIFFDKENTDNWPVVKTSSVTGIGTTYAKSGGTIEYSGPASITARGVCWSKNPAPTIENSHTSDGSGTGGFTSTMHSLAPNTTYHVRAYATNQFGTYYGDDCTFKTVNALPEVSTTAECSNFTLTSVKSGGTVIADHGFPVTARGVCWGTSPNPTADGNHTTDGSGQGSFTSSVTGINFSNATYYIRAYATNECGTGYGEEIVLKRNNPLNYPQFEIDGATYIIHPYINDANWSTAVSSCNSLVNVFSDWYLPSQQEMDVLMNKDKSIWTKNYYHWTSTHYTHHAYYGDEELYVMFYINSSVQYAETTELTTPRRVRPIRKVYQ